MADFSDASAALPTLAGGALGNPARWLIIGWQAGVWALGWTGLGRETTFKFTFRQLTELREGLRDGGRSVGGV